MKTTEIVSDSYVKVGVREKVGYGFGDLASNLLLKDTNIPITDISYTCGFSGHKQLIFAFNKYCRMTPTEFRKSYLTAINSAAELQIMTDFRCLPLDRQIVARLQSFNTAPQ
ncbi:helix-turn-helix domain-containing protein [Serratia sp. 2723]|uniref:helix-turn-helix domain-containing protein n=1 Tax=unclassified Serratia (in: enterobacteria) TaxID=2647522 RepID=UPI003D1AC3B5